MKQSICAAAWIILAAQSWSSSAAIFEYDDRVSISASASNLYAPIGIVRDGGRRATGFLVSRCHVLTVKHVLQSELKPGKRVKFVAVMASNMPSSRGSVTQAGAGHSRLDDWILIKLDNCLGDALGHVRLSSSSPFVAMPGSATYAPVSSAGYPVDRNRTSIAMDRSCSVVAQSRGEWLHNCATLPGNSGSPLFREVRTDHGRALEAFAIVTAGARWRRPVPLNLAYLNTATPFSAILPAIQNTMAIEAESEEALSTTSAAFHLAL